MGDGRVLKAGGGRAREGVEKVCAVLKIIYNRTSSEQRLS